jgi:hypothetical protein
MENSSFGYKNAHKIYDLHDMTKLKHIKYNCNKKMHAHVGSVLFLKINQKMHLLGWTCPTKEEQVPLQLFKSH